MGRIGENELSSSVVEKLNKTASLSKYECNIEFSQWQYDNKTDLYYIQIIHELNISESDIISIKLLSNSEEVYASYKIIDDDTLYIYSIDVCKGTLIIKY